MEIVKLVFNRNLLDGTFINLLRMLNKLIEKFSCMKSLATIDKLMNSIIINVSETLMINIHEILDYIISFDLKLLDEVIIFPINLYKIFIFYRDPNNPEKKYLEVIGKKKLKKFKEIKIPLGFQKIHKFHI